LITARFEILDQSILICSQCYLSRRSGESFTNWQL